MAETLTPNPATTDNTPIANVGKVANSEKFANVGKLPANVVQMPTLANRRNLVDFKALPWRRTGKKPPAPKGYYWQASGSKTTGKVSAKKRTLFGWTLIRNGKCQRCKTRYRPPVAYLKGESWDSLKGESYERQKAEIRLLLGKRQRLINDLRCPECLSGNYGQVSDIGRTG